MILSNLLLLGKMTDSNVLVRCPPPRPLSQKETLDSLNHWKTLFRNYFRRDSIYKQFLATNFTWDPSQANYGLATVGTDTAEARKENLEDFLYTLAGFLPHSYLTTRLSRTLSPCNSVGTLSTNTTMSKSLRRHF